MAFNTRIFNSQYGAFNNDKPDANYGNGAQGNVAPAAVQERNEQIPSSGGDPFGALVSHVSAYAHAIAPQGIRNGDPGGGHTSAPPVTPPSVTPPPDNTVHVPTGEHPTNITPAPPPAPDPNNHMHHPSVPSTLPPKPTGATYSDYAWQKANLWVQQSKNQGYDYGWLIQHPEVIDMYTEFVNAGKMQDGTNPRANIHFVDYVKHMFPQYPSPAAGFLGHDTFNYDGSLSGGSPNVPNGGFYGFGAGSPTTQPPVGGTYPRTPDAPTTQPPPDPTRGVPPPNAQPPATPPVTSPVDPNAPPPSSAPPPTGTTPSTQGDALARMQAAIHEQAARQMSDGERQLRASAALHHSSDSGAMDSAMAKYFGDSNANLATALATNDYSSFQQSQDRELQERLAQLGASTQRYGIDSSANTALSGQRTQLSIAQIQAQAQKYGDEVAANAQKYGVDANTAIQMGHDAAQKYATDMQYQLGLAGLDVNRENNLYNYMNGNQANILRYLQIILGISPDAILNGTDFPNPIINVPQPSH